MKLFLRVFLLLFVFSFVYSNSECQIKVFEKPTDKYIPNSGLFFDSEKRTRVNLDGIWDISFDKGKNFNKLNVPLSYSYEGTVIFKRTFFLNEELLKNSAFLFVCEGINYESIIKINNSYITKNDGGNSSIVILIDENILQKENFIEIEVNNKLDNSGTIPLANQINYSNNFGGINRDIYLLGVSKVFVANSYINYTIDNDNFIKVVNNLTIKSTNTEQLILEKKEFTIQTKLYKKSVEDEILSSDNAKFQIDNYSQINIENKFSIKNPSLWSPENPELYLVKTLIFNNENLVDEFVSEIGFTNVKINGNSVFINNKKFFLKGINYHEESSKYGTALDYQELQKDLTFIKSLGFNCIRVPGKSADIYTINVCNRIGLYLLQDFPFNEVPRKVLTKNKYTEFAFEYLENIIKRDRNSVSILAWGVGNNFDVTVNDAVNYVKSAKEMIRKYDSRPVYYTTRNYTNDNCIELADFRGINFYTYNFEEISNSVDNLSKKPAFISSFGVPVNNNNRNGYSDIFSMEFQTKYLTDGYKLFSKYLTGCFVASYSDWTASNPLNLSLDKNPYIKTDGIFTYAREPKQTVSYLKHLLNNQEIQKIMEGTPGTDESYFFIVAGLIMNIILLFSAGKIRKFKEILFKFTLKPRAFFEYAKEQTPIPFQYNLLLSTFINFGFSIYITSIFYFYRFDNSFDIFLSNFLTNDFFKILFSEYINTPYKFIIFTFFNFIIFQLVITVILYFVSFFTKGKTYFKNLYTITIWSSLPFLLFLPIGTIIFKLASSNNSYIGATLYLYLILTILFLYRIISGTRILLEINKFRAALYGILIIIFIYGGFYMYLFYKNTFSILNLLSSY